VITRMRGAMARLLKADQGPFTDELMLAPTPHGALPSRLAPESVVTTVCGFCSTGCGLNVHLKNGRAINLTPTADYPVNLGMACPKGWESLTPLASP